MIKNNLYHFFSVKYYADYISSCVKSDKYILKNCDLKKIDELNKNKNAKKNKKNKKNKSCIYSEEIVCVKNYMSCKTKKDVLKKISKTFLYKDDAIVLNKEKSYYRFLLRRLDDSSLVQKYIAKSNFFMNVKMLFLIMYMVYFCTWIFELCKDNVDLFKEIFNYVDVNIYLKIIGMICLSTLLAFFILYYTKRLFGK